MKKIFTSLLLFAASMSYASAQEQSILDLKAEVRMDYQREYVDGDAVKPNSGFKGKYLNIILNGTINEHFSYAYRQRLNKPHKDASFFDATDWVYLTYKANDHWSFSVGKQVVGVGIEYYAMSDNHNLRKHSNCLYAWARTPTNRVL